MVGQFPLFDSHTLNGQTTVEDAIDATHAEQREQIARAAAEVEQEPTSGAEEAEQGHTEGAHTAALVAFVRGYALARSEDGRDAWDVLIETYTRAQIAELLGDATNETDAVARAAARVAQIMAQYNAEEPEAPVISGPWGVFESDLCIASVDDRATADMLAAEAVAADDGASEVVVRALCAEHVDAEQPRDTCEECAADGDDEEDEDSGSTGSKSLYELFGPKFVDGEDVHAWEDPCGSGGVNTAWDSLLVTCEDCLRIGHPERYETPALSGDVITHHGAALGSEPDVADDTDVRDAVAALVEAGHVPAPLTGEYDDETCTANGFMVHPIGDGMVHVYHLVNGQTVEPNSREWWTADLAAYRATLDAAGWTTRRPSMCLRANRPTEASGPEVDVDALGMSPKVRALVCDIDAGPWHYQTRKGAHTKGLTTDIKATALTAFGERVRAALLAE
jgi:hypothetical protein